MYEGCTYACIMLLHVKQSSTAAALIASPCVLNLHSLHWHAVLSLHSSISATKYFTSADQHQMKSGSSTAAKPILKCIFTYVHYSRSCGGQASTSKRTWEKNLTFTFAFTITLEPIWVFTAIILQITDTTTKISGFVRIFFNPKQNKILLIIWQF